MAAINEYRAQLAEQSLAIARAAYVNGTISLDQFERRVDAHLRDG